MAQQEVEQDATKQWDAAVAAYARLMERCGDLMSLVVPAAPATSSEKEEATEHARAAFERFLEATATLEATQG